MNHHARYRLMLVIVLLLSLFLIYQINYSKVLQSVIVLFASLFYVGWGIFHHWVHHDLTAKIVLEYVLVGSLGMVIILFFLRGGIV